MTMRPAGVAVLGELEDRRWTVSNNAPITVYVPVLWHDGPAVDQCTGATPFSVLTLVRPSVSAVDGDLVGGEPFSRKRPGRVVHPSVEDPVGPAGLGPHGP